MDDAFDEGVDLFEEGYDLDILAILEIEEEVTLL